MGPCLCGLLDTLWDRQQAVLRQNGFHRPALPATRGTAQGGLVSLTLFNVVVDNFIRTWLSVTVEDQRVAHYRLVETSRQFLGVFYAYDVMVGSRDAEWLQHSMHVLVGLFRRYGLASNVAKSCTMTCQPGSLRSGISEEAKALKCTGLDESYRVQLRRRIPCLECGFEITLGSMTARIRHKHRTEPAIDWIRLLVSQTEHQPQVYDVIFLRSTNQVP